VTCAVAVTVSADSESATAAATASDAARTTIGLAAETELRTEAEAEAEAEAATETEAEAGVDAEAEAEAEVEAGSEVEAETEAEVEVDAESEAESESESEAESESEVEVEGGPTGRKEKTPYIDPHWWHREQPPVDNDVYALKLCCTSYTALDEAGHYYHTCSQQFFWVCNTEKCSYKPPKTIPKGPFSAAKKCPPCQKVSHSNFGGPCLCECSQNLLSPELAHDGAPLGAGA